MKIATAVKRAFALEASWFQVLIYEGDLVWDIAELRIGDNEWKLDPAVRFVRKFTKENRRSGRIEFVAGRTDFDGEETLVREELS